MEKKVTNSFQMFMEDTKFIGRAYMDMVMKLSQECALDRKFHELSYISVLSAVRLHSGLRFHVISAKQLGASKEEVKSAVFVGLPAVGIMVIDALEIAMNAYDEAD